MYCIISYNYTHNIISLHVFHYHYFYDTYQNTSIGCKGNLLIDRLMGSKIVLCPYRSTANVVLSDGTVLKGLGGLMEQYAETLR